jgi:hypothetical protein
MDSILIPKTNTLRQDNGAILCIYKKLFTIGILLYMFHFRFSLSI